MKTTHSREGRACAVLLLAASLGLASACGTPVPATVTLAAHFLKSEPIYVTVSSAYTGKLWDATTAEQRETMLKSLAAEQRETIVTSLTDAGLHPTNDSAGAGYELLVRLGTARGRSRCGIVHNVIYILTAAGRQVAIVKARGQTAGCTPNVFGEMSVKLASIAGE